MHGGSKDVQFPEEHQAYVSCQLWKSKFEPPI